MATGIAVQRCIVLCGLVLAGTVSPLEAVVVGNGTPASCTEAALNAAFAVINPAGGTITFNCGGAATINITSQKLLYNPDSPNNVYNIDGGGLITLNAQGLTRHIFHLSGSLNVANITFTGGRARGTDDNASGGAIRSDRNPAQVPAPVGLSLVNVTFTNNTTELTGATPPFSPFDYGGAAVFSRLEFLTVTNCTFTNNLASNNSGGAIHARSSTINITNSSFVSNVSNGGGFGGAIMVDGLSPNGANGSMQITGSTFSNNTAWNQGGGIFFFLHAGKAESVTLDTVNVVGNRVVESGAVVFVGNRGWGGGLAGDTGSLTIRNSTFANNSVRGQVSTNGGGLGGGISLVHMDGVSITNSTISGNQALGGAPDAQGGALLVAANQPFQISHSTITLNQAAFAGGGIHGVPGVLTNTIVANNTAPQAAQCTSQLTNGGGALQFPDSSPRCANAIVVANPLLGALASNGGFTQTHHPQPGSPAKDAVPCAAATDQRGVARPQGSACDIGSVEVACSVSVSPLTLPTGRVGTPYSQVFSISGGANPITVSQTGALPAGMSFNASTRTLSGTPSQSGNFPITISASDAFACSASRPYNLTIASTVAVNPTALAVDAGGNGVLEVNQTAVVDPSWTNLTGGGVNLTGTLSSLLGPGGATYTITDGSAAYGVVAPGATARCSTATGNCYSVNIAASGRPEVHWDASAVESLSTGGPKSWTLHVGGSFADMPASNPFFRYVETLLHRGVTSGCGGSLYCSTSSTTREQMAVFVLVAKEGAGYTPVACSPPNTFNDVPETSPFCRFIEELARRGVVGGCGGNNYCPASPVTRDQMAVFALRTLDPTLNPPACAPPNMFNDVPETSPFCRWIEELARRGVVGGCAPNLYCPASPVTREQMGVFLSATFGLTLYGP